MPTRESTMLGILGALSINLVLVALIPGCTTPREEPTDAGVTPAATTPGAEQDAEAVATAHRAFLEAYQTENAEGMIGLLDDSPDLLIFHPLRQNRFDSVDEIRDFLSRMFAGLDDATWTDVHSQVSVEGDVAWLTTEMLLEAHGMARPFVARGTEIWRRQPAGWRLAHAHWSRNPEQQQP